MRGMGWRRCEPPEPANEAGGVKPQLNAGSLVLQGRAAHIFIIFFLLDCLVIRQSIFNLAPFSSLLAIEHHSKNNATRQEQIGEHKMPHKKNDCNVKEENCYEIEMQSFSKNQLIQLCDTFSWHRNITTPKVSCSKPL